MKISKFMFAAAVAAMTMASCQKQEPAQESKNLKSVEVQISNVFSGTKAANKFGNLEGQKVMLKSVQFFFSDGTTLYEAKDAQGNKADVYYDSKELAAMSNITAKFHFLPASVKKVIVLGNYTEMVATQESALYKEVEIINCQDVENLPLYAEGLLGAPQSNTHNSGENPHLSNVYKVDLRVLPPVARFEITGLGCSLPTSSSKIVKVNSMAFADFYDRYNIGTGALNSLRSVALTQQGIFAYFQQQMSPSKWNNDFFNELNGEEQDGNCHPVAEFTATNPSLSTNIAYNFFCNGAPSPVLLLNVAEYENAEAMEQGIATPGYLQTNTYRLNSTEAVTTFEPGKIYRMAINFSEDDLQHQDRCLDITLEVVEWSVINVTPEF